MDSRIFPYSECYCADGWFGPQCQHQTTWGPGQGSSFNREEFKEVSLGGDVELLWRVKDSTEVEIIMTAPTLSWLGLGWRPANTDQTCRDFPAGLGRYTDRTLHAMDCMDIVLGAARGGLGRVADYYTRDRSTPRLDSVWVNINLLSLQSPVRALVFAGRSRRPSQLLRLGGGRQDWDEVRESDGRR